MSGRSCLWLSKCHPLQGGHAKNCLNPIHRRKVLYLEVSKCYPLEGGHIYVLLRCIVCIVVQGGRVYGCLNVQGGRVYGCLNVIHCKEVMSNELSKSHPQEEGPILRSV